MHSLTIPVSIVLNTGVQLHNSVWMGAMNRTPTPTECTLRIVHVHQRLPTCTHCRGRFIVPAYYGIHGVDILCFINFVFHLRHSICALMIFFFGSKHSRSIEKPPFHLTHYANVLKLKDHTSSELDEQGDR